MLCSRRAERTSPPDTKTSPKQIRDFVMSNLSSKICCCCGGDAGRYKQHWNRDTGYGLCERCIDFCAEGTPEADFEETYGKPGVHYARRAKQYEGHADA